MLGRLVLSMAAIAVSVLALTHTVWAGQVFLTGHDPDFHAQPGAGVGGELLRTGLSFATGGTYNDADPATKPFLWVESRISPPSGHLIGENSLGAVGLTLGTHYARANGAELASVNFANYSAIAIASSFGGLLTRAELDALIARSADIAAFVNAGGGLFASAECFPCGNNLLAGTTPPDLFGFVPVDVTSIGANPPFTVTAFGASLGLSDAEVNDPTHNSFGLVGGLMIVDTDRLGNATTLAGNVSIDDGGFIPTVPEPTSLLLLGFGLAGVGVARRLRRSVQPD